MLHEQLEKVARLALRQGLLRRGSEAEKLREQEAEIDKQERLKAVFEQVDKLYQQGLESMESKGSNSTTDYDGGSLSAEELWATKLSPAEKPYW